MSASKKETKDTAATANGPVTIRAAVRDAVTSRFFVVLTFVCLVELLVLVIIALVHIRTGLTMKTHCEVSNQRVIECAADEAPWYYIFNFVALPIVIFVSNLLVSLKILALKGRQLALCWLWLTILVGLVVVVLGSAMIMYVV